MRSRRKYIHGPNPNFPWWKKLIYDTGLLLLAIVIWGMYCDGWLVR